MKSTHDDRSPADDRDRELTHRHDGAHRHAAEPGYLPIRSRPPATGATTAPGLGEVIGWVNGAPVPRRTLDRRLAGLRDGPMRAALPAQGSAEERQLTRWLTQVILTELLCAAETRALGLDPAELPPLDRLAAVELGSINAAAVNGSPWARALYEHLPIDVPTAWRRPETPAPRPALHVRHRLYATRPDDGGGEAGLDDLGPTSLDTLPAAIAAELRRQPYGRLAGPVLDELGWHLAIARPLPPATARHPAAEPTADTALTAAARRRAFARWLDALRADRIALVPGLEHPGDPRQPDNHHKH